MRKGDIWFMFVGAVLFAGSFIEVLRGGFSVTNTVELVSLVVFGAVGVVALLYPLARFLIRMR